MITKGLRHFPPWSAVSRRASTVPIVLQMEFAVSRVGTSQLAGFKFFTLGFGCTTSVRLGKSSVFSQLRGGVGATPKISSTNVWFPFLTTSRLADFHVFATFFTTSRLAGFHFFATRWFPGFSLAGFQTFRNFAVQPNSKPMLEKSKPMTTRWFSFPTRWFPLFHNMHDSRWFPTFSTTCTTSSTTCTNHPTCTTR